MSDVNKCTAAKSGTHDTISNLYNLQKCVKAFNFMFVGIKKQKSDDRAAQKSSVTQELDGCFVIICVCLCTG